MTLSIRRRTRQQAQDAALALTPSESNLPSPERAVPISRRLLLAGGGAPVSAAAMAMPVASALAEDPATRVARLAEELSVALDSYMGGSFRAIIEPDSKSTCPVLFQNRRRLDARDRLNRGMGASRDALAEIHG